MKQAKNVIDYAPPKNVRAALKRGLELKDEFGGKGLREHTVDWARHFVAGKPSNAAQARRMRAWFHRHKVDKAAGWDDPPTPGYVAWLLWGGDAGERWAEGLVAKAEAQGSDSERPLADAKHPPARRGGRTKASKAKAGGKKARKKVGKKAAKKTSKKVGKKAAKKASKTAGKKVAKKASRKVAKKNGSKKAGARKKVGAGKKASASQGADRGRKSARR